MDLAAPRKVSRWPQFHAREPLGQGQGVERGPVILEVGHVEVDHLVLLPLRHVDFLQQEIGSAEAQAGESVLPPACLKADRGEELERRFKTTSRRDEWIEPCRLSLHANGRSICEMAVLTRGKHLR